METIDQLQYSRDWCEYLRTFPPELLAELDELIIEDLINQLKWARPNSRFLKNQIFNSKKPRIRSKTHRIKPVIPGG